MLIPYWYQKMWYPHYWDWKGIKERYLPDQHCFQHTHIAFTFDSWETTRILDFVQLCKLESENSSTFGLRVTWPPKSCAIAWWPKLMPTVFTFLSNSLISCILAPQSYRPATRAQLWQLPVPTVNEMSQYQKNHQHGHGHARKISPPRSKWDWYWVLPNNMLTSALPSL